MMHLSVNRNREATPEWDQNMCMRMVNFSQAPEHKKKLAV